MAYDEGLAERIREILVNRGEVEEKKMFGGLCFMVSNHMACGIVKDTLMARVGPDNYQTSLAKDHVSEMNFTGKSMKGMIYVAPQAVESDSDLSYWVDMCVEFVNGLSPKRKKRRKTRPEADARKI